MSANRDRIVHVDPITGEPYIELAGTRIWIKSREETNEASLMVCGPVSYFPDDVHATCVRCGTAIVHRPSTPPNPLKVCMACAVASIKEMRGQ